MRTYQRISPEINSSSMADIAFLLLIFFLVTTTIMNDKGLLIQLPPPPQTDKPKFETHDRNLFKIKVNSFDQILVNGVVTEDLKKIREDIKAFVLNKGKDKTLSVSPDKAIVSIKINRGTSYARFVDVLNASQGAYYDIYATNVKLSTEEYRNLDVSNPEEMKLIQKAKKGIPMNISIAEPD